MTRVSVVTGAAGEMGAACARRLAMRPDALLLSDRRAEPLERIAEEIRSDRSEPVVVQPADITKDADMAALAEAAHGLGDLGSLVHAAGISPAMGTWRDLVLVNFVGTWRMLRTFELLAGSGSCAVTFSSMAGRFLTSTGRDVEPEFLSHPDAPDLLDRLEAIEGGFYTDPSFAYRWSKRGVRLLCEQLAPSWGARGARVVSISPGLIWGPMQELELTVRGEAIQQLLSMTPAGRWGTAEDIANVVEFLTSDAASFLTGCDVAVDGGLAPLVTVA